jgi:hypothetical protein
MATVISGSADNRRRPDQAAAASRGASATVKLLYVDHCPTWSLAADRLRTAIAESGLDCPPVAWRPVHDIRSAPGFAGSPTLLINGVDPFPRPASVSGLCCRMYRTEDGLSGAPSVEQIVAALRGHLGEHQ